MLFRFMQKCGLSSSRACYRGHMLTPSNSNHELNIHFRPREHKAYSNGLSSPGFTPPTGFIHPLAFIPPPNHMQPHSSTSPPRNIPPGFIPHPPLFPPPIFQHPGHVPPGSIPPPGFIPPPGCIPPPTFPPSTLKFQHKLPSTPTNLPYSNQKPSPNTLPHPAPQLPDPKKATSERLTNDHPKIPSHFIELIKL